MRSRTPLLAAASCGLLAITACTDASRFENEDPNRNRNGGAVIGAVTGAIVGSKVSGKKNKGKGIIIGAIVGAGAGATIGDRLDKQEADLRRRLGNDQVLIQNTGQELIVTMPQDILFSVNSAVVRNDLRTDLTALARNLMDFPRTTVQVIGHTDSTGSAEYNLGLSQRRASAVGNVLVSNGVPGGRVRAIGRGETQPVASNDTDAGRSQNRRVNIVITPTQ